MTTTKNPAPPKGLAAGGLDLWRQIIKLGPFRADHLRLLSDACREADLIDRLEEELRTAPTTVLGSMKQTVEHPHVAEIRQHRMSLRYLLKALDLPDVDRAATDKARQARRSALERATEQWAQ
jgi:hypothetical protein